MLPSWRPRRPSEEGAGPGQLSRHARPLHADRRVRLHQRRRGVGTAVAQRRRGVDVRSAVRLAERLRQHPRPARRLVQDRARRRHGARRRPLPARHDDLGDQLGYADRLDHRPRRAADRSVAPRERPVQDLPRTPSDYEAEHILLRTIRCASGEVQTIVDCEPVFDYGRAPAMWDVHRRELLPGRGHAPRDPTSSSP